MSHITIVTYHYVRDLNRSRYPEIKGLQKEKFIRQIEYLNRNFNILRMEQCIDYIYGNNDTIPENAALLTFDDGYLEHFTEVFPILNEKKVQGSFFPPVESTIKHKVLDVNKIHFILAVCKQPEKLLDILAIEIKNLQNEYQLKDPIVYFDKIEASEHPYDTIEVLKFKRVLQRELPYQARHIILSAMFKKFVGVREDVFSNELYMNESQLKTLIRSGMFVGGHGYSHEWLNSMDEIGQKREMEKTKSFLDSIGVPKDEKVMCYPYGGYNASLIRLTEKLGFAMGLTINPERALLNMKNRYKLGRFDTNEIKST